MHYFLPTTSKATDTTDILMESVPNIFFLATKVKKTLFPCDAVFNYGTRSLRQFAKPSE